MPLLENPPFAECPSHELVRRFNSGELPDDTFERIAVHLADCEKCYSSAEHLQHRSQVDPLVEALRRSFGADFTVGEAGDRLAMTAGALPPPDFATRQIDSSLLTSIGGKQFGGYELISVIGHGGMGVVYKALQKRLNRFVAIKTILAGAHAAPAAKARFGAEGEAVARLKHPCVVQIFEFGEHEGVPYFSMELAEGGTLRDLIARGPLSSCHAAELTAELADAVHYAHSQNVIHRDLKPGNILLDHEGAPKVTDFGLAKLLDLNGTDTRSDAIMGTPAYMAPEQASESSRETDGRADIYSLGAILYEMLTGDPPFDAASRAEVLRMVQRKEPTPPSVRVKDIPRDLELICLKCLEKSPNSRYATAAALADDLRACLAGAPTVAAAREWRSRVRRQVRKHGVKAVAGGAVLFAMIAFSFYDPDRSLRAVEAKLAHGESVALIGDEGLPEWYDWRIGGDSASMATGFDGIVTIKAPDVALLELVKNPGRRPYRFSVEIAQENGANLNGHVGIFCCAQDHPTYLGPGHAFAVLTFNDIFAARKFAPAGAGVKIPVQEVSQFACRLYATKAGHNDCRLNIVEISAPQIIAAGAERGPWRRLDIEVRDTGFKVSIDGQPLGELSGIEISHQTAVFNELNKSLHSKLPPGSPLIQASWPTDFQGSLGIFASHAIASFRHASVTPL